MHITIFGTEAGSRLLARALTRENHRVSLWIPKTLPLTRELRECHLHRYDGAEAILAEDFSATDAFIFCSKAPYAPVVAAHLARLGKPVHYVAYDRTMARLLEAERENLGIDYLYDYGHRVAERIHHFFYVEEGMQTEVFKNFGSALIKIDIGDDPTFVGRRVKNIGPLEELVLVSIRRDGKVLVPGGNTALETGDVLRLIGSAEAVRRFRRRHTPPHPLDPSRPRRFMIFGSGSEAGATRSYLNRVGADTVILGEDKALGPREKSPLLNLSERYETEEFDGFIAASENDAENFLAASAARDAGLGPVAICLKDERLMRVVDVSESGGLFSGELLVSQEIKRNLFGPPDISLHMFPGRLDIYEITLQDDVDATDRAIEELDLARGFLIGGIERDGKSVLAKGRTVLRAGDRLILVLLPERAEDLKKFIRRKPRNFLTELFSF